MEVCINSEKSNKSWIMISSNKKETHIFSGSFKHLVYNTFSKLIWKNLAYFKILLILNFLDIIINISYLSKRNNF